MRIARDKWDRDSYGENRCTIRHILWSSIHRLRIAIFTATAYFDFNYCSRMKAIIIIVIVTLGDCNELLVSRRLCGAVNINSPVTESASSIAKFPLLINISICNFWLMTYGWIVQIVQHICIYSFDAIAVHIYAAYHVWTYGVHKYQVSLISFRKYLKIFFQVRMIQKYGNWLNKFPLIYYYSRMP